MAMVFADRVKETTTTTGTGTLDLGGAAVGFQSFVAGIGNTNECSYCITDDTYWEVGEGTVTDASPDTLSRDTILASSNSDAAVNWTSGTKNVFVVYPAGVVAVTSYTNSTNNRIITSVDSTTVNGEANLTFDGSVLAATGNITATGTVEPAGDTAAGDNAAIGYTSAEGLILTGQGSTNDVTIKNDADAEVMGVLTGTTTAAFTGQVTGTGFTGTLDGILGSGTPAAATVTTIDASGVATATTFEPDGDTAAGDNAAIGYTSAEGLILTGQGSTNDVTIKNDADGTVISIPTGTTNVTIAGDLTISGDDLTMATNTSGAALIADGTNFNPVVISGDISINTSGVAAIGSGVIVEADIADNAVTLAKMAGGTDGNIISYDASGDPVAVATGTDGQVLTSAGAGQPPAFEDAGGGGASDINGLSDAITNSSGATVGLGTGALANDDGTTNKNTALGYGALNSNTSGYNNTAVGYEALEAHTENGDCAAIGYQALYSNIYGERNTAVGKDALKLSTTGSSNSAIGAGALDANTTGGSNTAIGDKALSSNTTGSYNIALGYEALDTNTTGSKHSAFGYQALKSNTTGPEGTAFGYKALLSNTTGTQNVAVGNETLRSNTTADYNTAFGTFSLYLATTGGYNSALGFQALKNNDTGTNNVAVGYQAGDLTTTGSNNTSLGYGSDPTANDADNEVTLGDANVSALRCQVQTISALSDRRDKKSIKELPVGLDFINDLKPVKFVWDMRNGGKKDIQEIGFIAQDLDESQINADAEDYLNLVLKNNPDKLEASYGKLVPILVKAVQELSAEVNQLKEKLNN